VEQILAVKANAGSTHKQGDLVARDQPGEDGVQEVSPVRIECMEE